MTEEQTELPLTEVEVVDTGSILPAINVNPADFGVELSKAMTMQQAFTPYVIEMNNYDLQYADIVNSEITPTLCKQASELRKKYVKSRTGVGRAHKAEKDFYLAGGRFVDAIKNKVTESCSTREDKLLEIEEYFEKKEAERLRLLADERRLELSKYTDDVVGSLDIMLESVYVTLLAGYKDSYKKRIEQERIDGLRESRTKEIEPYLEFIGSEIKTQDLGLIHSSVYDAALITAKATKLAKEQEAIDNQKAKDEELKTLRAQNESNAKTQELVMLRCSELAGMGMKFDTSLASYIGNGYEVRNTDIQTVDNATWAIITAEIKSAYELSLVEDLAISVSEETPTKESVDTATTTVTTSITTPPAVTATTRRARIINWVKSWKVDELPDDLKNDPDALNILSKINGCKTWINNTIQPIKD